LPALSGGIGFGGIPVTSLYIIGGWGEDKVSGRGEPIFAGL